MRLWIEIVRLLKGKRIAVLGANSSGKTTLHTFLRQKRLIKEYEITNELVLLDAGTYSNEKSIIHIKKGVDINGSQDFIKYWEPIIKDSHYCFFLFDTYKLIQNNSFTKEYIDYYLPFAASLAQKYDTKFIVIGNFADKIPNFDSTAKAFKNLLRPLIINAIDETGIRFQSILFGSMHTEEATFKLLDQISNQLEMDYVLRVKSFTYRTFFFIILILILLIFLEKILE